MFARPLATTLKQSLRLTMFSTQRITPERTILDEYYARAERRKQWIASFDLLEKTAASPEKTFTRAERTLLDEYYACAKRRKETFNVVTEESVTPPRI